MKTPPRLLLPLVSVFLLSGMASAGELFPFVLPWNDASPAVANLSHWLEKPAGRDGFVHVREGHLFAGEKRFRIFGVNMAFGANFPRHSDAGEVAARMAKFGINCVRFHHMEMQSAPGGIWAKDLRRFDPEQLDRLDFFIAELKKHGIYSNLNLHVSRTYPDRPAAEKAGNPNYDAGVDNFAAEMIALQKEYARTLLTHVNPYTGNAYIDEPAVALIEINNENSLAASWNWGHLDKIASPYRAELSALWLQWLREKYGTDEQLSAAWSAGLQPAGPELLRNRDFSEGLTHWHVEQHEGAVMKARVRDQQLAIEVTTPGSAAWHGQLNQGGLKLAANETYAVSFRARAGARREVSINLGQTHSPWKIIDSKLVTLTPEWQNFSLLLQTSATEENARLGITGLGAVPLQFEFADFSVRTAALDASVPRTAFTKAEVVGRTPAAQRDWHRFLWALESKYWPGMYDFLRNELKARSLIVGTQLGWSPFPIQGGMDVIDSHAYWQHPHFPGRSWDPENWSVKHLSMAGLSDGGTLPSLAMQRVAGKPYLCTEYSHPAPNGFAGESFPLVCAYAALQDWDGIFAFAYSHRHNDWAKGYVSSFFDIDQHPTKMATLPASLALFLRGDVRPAKEERIATVPIETVQEHARRNGPRIGAEHFGVDPLSTFVHRVGIRLGNTLSAPNDREEPGLVSDTGELTWNSGQRVVVIDTPKSKGVIGTLRDQRFDLGEVQIASPAAWATIQLTVLEGADFKSAGRMLVTATGTTENSAMKWLSPARESVGREWGRAPSLVEGIAARITFPGGGRLQAWTLDERGQRRTAVPMTNGILEIDPQYRTLWYEVTRE
ncbi:MAG: carbohydrate binding domain-containing protein [Verrucomicrobiota bacterium]